MIFHDRDSNSGAQTTAVSYSWSHTTSGKNRFLAVGIVTRPSPVVVSGVTYNSIALTKAPNTEKTNGNRYSVIYYLVNPAEGTNTIQVTTSGATPTDGGAVASSFMNVIGFDAGSSSSSASTNNPTTVTTTVASNSWIFDVLCESNIESSETPTSPQVKVATIQLANSSIGVSYIGPIYPAAVTTTGWSMSTGSTAYSAMSFSPIPSIPLINYLRPRVFAPGIAR